MPPSQNFKKEAGMKIKAALTVRYSIKQKEVSSSFYISKIYSPLGVTSFHYKLVNGIFFLLLWHI